jgi:hypothetical protein
VCSKDPDLEIAGLFILQGMTLAEISRTVEEINASINERKVGNQWGRQWGC